MNSTTLPGSIHSIGLFGGTFDPVHIGHLRSAVELRKVLALDQMHLMPCAVPPHGKQPEVSAQHRLAMLRLAIDGEPGLRVDERELQRVANGKPSYTIDSVVELRDELGPQATLCLCIGMDSLVNLASWHRWQELLDYVHLVVVARPGWHAPDGGAVAELLSQCSAQSVEQLHGQPAGLIWQAALTLLPVSSTEIRDALGAGHSVRYLLPELVMGYINHHDLYT